MVVTAFILTGQYLNFRMRKRISSLNDYIFLIEGINSQISFSQKNIREIINELTSSENIRLRAMNELKQKNDMDFSVSWKEAITVFGNNDCLNKEDEKILLSFGSALGLTDLQGQSNNCRLHIGMLTKQLHSAEEKLKEKSKITTALSVFSAVVAVIIFY